MAKKEFEYGLDHAVQVWWENAVDAFLTQYGAAKSSHGVTYEEVLDALLGLGHKDMADEFIDFLSIGE